MPHVSENETLIINLKCHMTQCNTSVITNVCHKFNSKLILNTCYKEE